MIKLIASDMDGTLLDA
ncbi:MAG TPA: hypothetical protein PLU84_05815, partial [Enterococcus aquimarinus]|nr:hypothetical protein [Enterococcus aquimarinus]